MSASELRIAGNARLCIQCSRPIEPLVVPGRTIAAASCAAWIAGFCGWMCAQSHAVEAVSRGQAWWQKGKPALSRDEQIEALRIDRAEAGALTRALAGQAEVVANQNEGLRAELERLRAQLDRVRHDCDEMIRVHDEVEADRDRLAADLAALRGA